MRRSTKPFRRLWALVFANIYLFSVAVYVATSKKVARLTHSDFYIDKLENPTLYRAYFINRSRPVELREKEFQSQETFIKQRSDQKALDASREHSRNLLIKQEKHRLEAEKWQYDFEEDERAKAAEEARQAALLAAEQEKERQRIYAEQRQKEIDYERATQLDELKRREELYHASTNSRKDFRSPVRAVGVHAVTVRNLPSTQCRSISQMTTGAVVTIDGWIRSEVHYGNGVWFRMVKSREFPNGGWVWSGAFTNQSIETLADLNEEGDSFTIKSADGTVVQQIQCSTPMEDLIQNEIRRLNQGTRIEDGKITTGYINAGIITADRLNVGPVIMDTGSGVKITEHGITGLTPHGLTAPPAISNKEIEDMKKMKRDYDRKSRELRDAKDKLKRQKQEHDRQQSINLMNSTVNSAIASMNYASSHSSD